MSRLIVGTLGALILGMMTGHLCLLAGLTTLGQSWPFVVILAVAYLMIGYGERSPQ